MVMPVQLSQTFYLVVEDFTKIWLGKILANDVLFAKFAKVFPRQNFALYGIINVENLSTFSMFALLAVIFICKL